MASLKLFISHSSRLDDDAGAVDTDENWDLLRAICDTLRARDLGVQVEILVDQFIGSGQDWEKHLNLWLAECHAAIILYSKRALDHSDWVKKEATILHWRWQVEEGFALLPVFFEDETTIEDATDSLWKAIGIDQVNAATCPRHADAIVDRIAGQPQFQRLANRLKNTDRFDTPFDAIADELIIHLDDDRLFNDLQAAWNRLNHPDKPATAADSATTLAHNLARFLLTSPAQCLEKLHSFANQVVRKETRERLREVHAAVRAIWVDAGAAAQLPSTHKGDVILALNGIHLDDPAVATANFTVDRYLKRVWHKDRAGVLVPLTDQTGEDDIEREIWKRCRINNANSRPERLRKQVNRKDFVLVYLPFRDSDTGLPDAQRAREILGLRRFYPRLRVLLATGEQALDDELADIRPIHPPLDSDTEDDQYVEDLDLQATLSPQPR